MKRLLIMTVGKTHSGKSSFAKELETLLPNTLVIDQDNHAEFINTYYKKLQPDKGLNTLNFGLTEYILKYAIDQTKFHLILCNSNINKEDRLNLLNKFFPKEYFVRIIVHFDLSDKVLLKRVRDSTRNTNIFRGDYSNFEQVLTKQLNEKFIAPSEDEADYLFAIKDNRNNHTVINEIVQLEQVNNMNEDNSELHQKKIYPIKMVGIDVLSI